MPATSYAEGLGWPVDEMEGAARSALEQLRVRIHGVYPKTDAQLRQGVDWRQILDAAEQEHCDLIVMGTHGRRGMPRFILGSVAEKVIRFAPMPVLTVHAAKPEEPK